MKNDNFKSRSLFAIIAVVMCLIITSCSANEPVEIRWFVGLGTGTNDEQRSIQNELVEEFNNSQSEIILKIEYVSASSVDILQTQIAAGNAPDIIGPVGIANRGPFEEALLDLEPYIQKYEFDLSLYDPQTLDLYDLKGSQTGIPIGLYPSFIWYNKDLFDEASLPYPPSDYGEPYIWNGIEYEWNYDTIALIGKELTVDSMGRVSTDSSFDNEDIVQFGYGMPYANLRGLLTPFGAYQMYDENGKAVIPAEWADAVRWYHDAIWVDQFYPSNVYSGSTILNQGNWFASGNIAMVHTYLWYTCCVGSLGSQWDIAPMPASLDGSITSNMNADAFSISKSTEHPDEAFITLAWLLTNGIEELTVAYGSFPARQDLRENYYAELDAEVGRKNINWDVMNDSIQFADVPNHEESYPNELRVRNVLVQFQQTLMTDPDMDVSAELIQLQEDLQTLFDQEIE